jgi:hypothetical protein
MREQVFLAGKRCALWIDEARDPASLDCRFAIFKLRDNNEESWKAFRFVCVPRFPEVGTEERDLRDDFVGILYHNAEIVGINKEAFDGYATPLIEELTK